MSDSRPNWHAQARAANPDLAIIARAHSEAAEAHLRTQGASMVIMGEREIAGGMLQHAFGTVSGSALPPARERPSTA